MVVGAISQILENMAAFGKRRFANPVRPLATHLGIALGRAVHPLRHIMAANAGIGAGTLGYFGRGIMRTSGAEIRDADARIAGFSQGHLGGLQPGHRCGDPGIGRALQDAAANRHRNVMSIKRTFDRKEPCTLFIMLTDDRWLIGRAIKLFTHLHFYERAFFLNDKDEFQPGSKGDEFIGHHWPWAAELHQPQPQRVGPHFINTEIIERLTYIEIGFARGENADAGMRPAGHDDVIEAVDLEPRHDGLALIFLQAGFLLQNAIAWADVKAPRRHNKIVRHTGDNPPHRARHRGR